MKFKVFFSFMVVMTLFSQEIFAGGDRSKTNSLFNSVWGVKNPADKSGSSENERDNNDSLFHQVWEIKEDTSDSTILMDSSEDEVCSEDEKEVAGQEDDINDTAAKHYDAKEDEEKVNEINTGREVNKSQAINDAGNTSTTKSKPSM
ncbi:uncharacterized protein LOC126832990 isoform X2 [Adelges cooleyi]|uniref:uncharacterized protein LOC126832990 isoform X2 n=1 Tax=Adelges cooleyi TaxID=133065 RepID=UPI00217FE4D8|nr:uncharacterized protein LOC126832990 isoform X2 [Adelges cooleyi]